MFVPVTLQLLGGFWESLKIFTLTLAFSLPLGLAIAFGSMSKFTPLRALVRSFVWIIRGTPLMLQLIIIFYGPGMWFDNNIWAFGNGRMVACVVAFVFNYACYFPSSIGAASKEFPRGSGKPVRFLA